MRIPLAASVGDEKIANHSLAAFVYKKRIAENASAIEGRVARKNLGIDVAQNHVGGAAVIPGEQAGPEVDPLVEQRAQVRRGEMPEIENLHSRLLQGYSCHCVLP